MPDTGFSPEQQEYLKGFMAGVEARRGSLAPAAEGTAPADALRAAQDRTLAEGGKLVPQEQAKRERHPLDRWDELTARAAAGRFPPSLLEWNSRVVVVLRRALSAERMAGTAFSDVGHRLRPAGGQRQQDLLLAGEVAVETSDRNADHVSAADSGRGRGGTALAVAGQ